MAHPVTIWQYPKCSTCRKAQKWLADRGIATSPRDIVLTPPPVAVLRDLLKRSGLPISRFFNTSGESYRTGGFKDRLKTMSEAQALAALAADGKLIKRPLIDVGGESDNARVDAVLVGFDEVAYAATFKPGTRGARAR